jgi:DNA-binding transcriptional ArsR family regulator
MLDTFRALAEPSRLQIVDLLFREPLPVGVIADRLGMRQPQATKHLKTLSDSGVVEMRRDAQRRVYSLSAQPFRDIDGWLQRYRGLWEEQFDRLDTVLEELQASERSANHKPKSKRRNLKKESQ